MIMNYSTLREKDVVNVCDGRKIGCICDIQIDANCGKICALFVSDRFFGFSAQKAPIKIPYEKIACIGEDTVLVSLGPDFSPPKDSGECKKRKNAGKLFF